MIYHNAIKIAAIHVKKLFHNWQDYYDTIGVKSSAV